MNFKKAAATSSAIVIGATTILTGIPTSVSAAQVHTEVVQQELSTKETQAETKVGEDTKKEVKSETETETGRGKRRIRSAAASELKRRNSNRGKNRGNSASRN